MSLQTRLALYREVEKRRARPLIVYVTSNRLNAAGLIASDSVPELLSQLEQLPRDVSALDLLIVSDGGDPTVAWRIVSLIRERVKQFCVLVPQAAYSAATLIRSGGGISLRFLR
jgi:ClpP class serine protease